MTRCITGSPREYAAHAQTAPYNAMYDRPAVLSLLGDVSGLTVLDAGCGPGLYAELLQRGVDAIGFDQSPAMIDLARGRVGTDATTQSTSLCWHWSSTTSTTASRRSASWLVCCDPRVSWWCRRRTR
jgi:SAM-dependent methyltransferase